MIAASVTAAPPTRHSCRLINRGRCRMWLDGNAELRHVLAQSTYGSAAHAVASLTLFTHPDTVASTGGQSVFRIMRRKNQKDVGQISEGADGPVLYDDNTTPTNLFLWANRLSKRGCRDVQFNHVYPRSSRSREHSDVYTSLSNLCVTPAFLAKLTDTDDEVRALLRYRAYDLYRYTPTGVPPRPPAYEALTWADPLPPVGDLEGALRAAMRRCPRSRTTQSAREIGWLFSGFSPDPSL